MTTTSKSMSTLTKKSIFLYWLPLALSWVLMSFELPFISAAITRLPQAELMLASFGIVYSISLVIESPVINLLSTSTALVSNRNNYFKIRNFTIALMVGTTILHFLIAWTPLFNVVVTGWMNAPAEMENHIRLGLRLMVVWSGAIAWRRFLQGILIRYGKTKYIGQGTIVRLTASAGSAVILVLIGSLPGVAVASIGLAFGVISEGIFAYLVSRKTIREEFLSKEPISTSSDISLKSLLQFHWPLAATSLIFMATQPLISAALARGTNPVDDLAVWPVLSSMFFLFRAPTMAFPEMVIALYQGDDRENLIRSFTLKTGGILTVILAVIGFSPLAVFYLKDIIGLPENLAYLGLPGIHLAIAIPIANAVLNFYRGTLSAEKFTLPITIATILDVAGLALVLILGVSLQIPGIPTASIALTFGVFIDATLLYLYYRKRVKAKNGF